MNGPGSEGPFQSGSRRPDRWWIGAGIVLVTGAGLAGAIGTSLAAEARDAPALAVLAPLVGRAVALVGRLRAGFPAWGAGASLAAQAALAIAVAVTLGLSRRARIEDRDRGPWTAGELLAYLSLMAASLAIRFYAVNVVPGEWWGETWSHVAASTDLFSMTRRALGEAPVISQGLVWYAIEHLWVSLFGPSFAAGRILQATVSFVAVWVLHAFLRRIAGRQAALLGAALLAFSPVAVGWSRSEYLIPYVEVYAIALAFTTYAAGESPRRMTLLALSLGMGLGSLVYPAARLLPLLPLVYLPLRRRLGPGTAGAASRVGAALAAGGVLFLFAPLALRWMVFGRPGPFDPLAADSGLGFWAGPEALEPAARVLEVLRGAFSNAGWLVRSLFVSASDTWYTTISSFPPATLLSPFVAAFVGAGLFVALRRRRPADLLILLWIALAILPLLPAAGPDARRISAAFPAIAALAAVTGLEFAGALARVPSRRPARLVRAGVLCAVISVEALVRVGLFFEKPEGRPDASLVARAILPALTPGTLLVVDLKYNYGAFFEGKLFLELFDAVRHGKDVALFAVPGGPSRGDGELRLDPEAIPYRGTFLSRLPAAEEDRVVFAVRDVPVFLGRPRAISRWHRVVFILRNAPESSAALESIRRRHPASRTVIWPLGANRDCEGIVVVEAPWPPG